MTTTPVTPAEIDQIRAMANLADPWRLIGRLLVAMDDKDHEIKGLNERINTLTAEPASEAAPDPKRFLTPDPEAALFASEEGGLFASEEEFDLVEALDALENLYHVALDAADMPRAALRGACNQLRKHDRI